MRQLPKTGLPTEQLWAEMDAMRQSDANWQEGRTFSLVFDPGPEAQAVLKKAYTDFFSENALNPSAFPSLRKMEHEVVAMTATLLNGNAKIAGNITSGGTESILLAMKTARDFARDKRGIEQPNIVLPITAHPAHDKAGDYFGIEIRHTPVDEHYQADVDAMADAMDDNTILVGGSAVQYAQGVVDPIEAIGRLAKQRKVLCHVDACIGGFMLPFVERMGHEIPTWDFRVPGVTSISCDLHKYAYAAKGASVIMYRDRKLRRYQFHAHMDWPGGIYASPTMTGTRPGGSIAAAWAILHHLGEAGYVAIAKDVMESTVAIRNGIQDIAGIQVLGQPHMSILCVASDDSSHNIFAIGDELQQRGWRADRQQHPDSLHLTISRGHLGKESEFLQALADSVTAAQQRKLQNTAQAASLSITHGLAKVLPDPIFGVLSRAANKLGSSDGLPERSAAIYGMLSKLPARGELKELVLDALDQMHSLPNNDSATKADSPKEPKSSP